MSENIFYLCFTNTCSSIHRHVAFKDRVSAVFFTVHRQRRIQTTIPFLLKHPSLRAPCCRSSADPRLRIKRRPTPSILYTVSTNLSCIDPHSCKANISHTIPPDEKGFISCMCLCVSSGDRPRKLYAERALNLPLGAELITGNMWYMLKPFQSPLQVLLICCFTFRKYFGLFMFYHLLTDLLWDSAFTLCCFYFLFIFILLLCTFCFIKRLYI